MRRIVEPEILMLLVFIFVLIIGVFDSLRRINKDIDDYTVCKELCYPAPVSDVQGVKCSCGKFEE